MNINLQLLFLPALKWNKVITYIYIIDMVNYACKIEKSLSDRLSILSQSEMKNIIHVAFPK